MTTEKLSIPARTRRTAAERALDALIGLPVGAFGELAAKLVLDYPDVAAMLADRLKDAAAIPGNGVQHG